MKNRDRQFMQRCLDLARRGLGYVNPNPMVGCVIVKSGKIIAEGYHERFGGPHAEVNALKKLGRGAKGATLYVNLEPCSHFGKTPPCVDAIIAAGIKRVVAASQDPNPLVGGKGFAKLRAARVRTRVGVLRREAELLNEKFYTFMRIGLPFVAVKIAQTLDGRIADVHGSSKWITSESTRKEAHRLRAEYDAVLVGATTVRRDNPELTVRTVKGRNPVRIVIDGQLRLKPNFRVFNTRQAKTILVTSLQAANSKNSLVTKLSKQGVQVITAGRTPKLDPLRVLRALAGLGISSVLIEGGSNTIGTFLQKRRVHAVCCFIAPKFLGGGLASISFQSPLRLSRTIRLRHIQVNRFDNDILIQGSVVYP